MNDKYVFLEFHRFGDGEPVDIRLDLITNYEQYDTGTSINIHTDEIIRVSESVEEVRNMIKNTSKQLLLEGQ